MWFEPGIVRHLSARRALPHPDGAVHAATEQCLPRAHQPRDGAPVARDGLDEEVAVVQGAHRCDLRGEDAN